MNKIKSIVNSSWFKGAAAGAVQVLLLIDKDVLYAGIAFGIGIREFLLAFKSQIKWHIQLQKKPGSQRKKEKAPTQKVNLPNYQVQKIIKNLIKVKDDER